MFLFYNFPLDKASHFKVFPYSGIFLQGVIVNTYKYLQIAPLRIIFVDILPKVNAVHFAEFFHK